MNTFVIKDEIVVSTAQKKVLSEIVGVIRCTD